jgi:hypothetical protein
MKKWLVASIIFMALPACKQQQQTERGRAENLVIITLDGLRWQEVFTGMDSSIAVNAKFNEGDSSYIFETYWHPDERERRKKIMPFLWSVMAAEGQIYGNRNFDNKADNANPYWFSYPGYNEIFTGYPDTAINSNRYPHNPHVTVLEFLNQQPGYKGKVAAITCWDAFDRILNEPRSGFPVFSAYDTISWKHPSASEKLVNRMLHDSYKPWHSSASLDVFTHYTAMEYLKNHHPKVLYISYGETDEWAHEGKYRSYLDAARQNDAWLQQIWNFIQSDARYKNKTALFVTVDHGRGIGDQWTSHNNTIEFSHQIWFAVMGPGIPAKGEIKASMQLYQQQFAQTFAKLLGFTYTAPHPIAHEIKSMTEP